MTRDRCEIEESAALSAEPPRVEVDHQWFEVCKDMARTEEAGLRATYGVTVLAGLGYAA
jgi:hypothetical protein